MQNISQLLQHLFAAFSEPTEADWQLFTTRHFTAELSAAEKHEFQRLLDELQ